MRVYATHSTHKTLTALRQGSMIHVWDQDFKDKVEESFHEAYMTHTSTSPNYQILASLDVGRRQVELEGYELIQRQLELAMSLREQVLHHPLLKRYFRFLRVSDMVPAPYRESGVDNYYNDETGWDNLEAAWQTDEFALDPTRATLTIGATGMDGDTFKNKELMDRYGIQINKTSRNTVLFMTNIGSTRSAIAYLIEVLVKIARDVDARVADMSSIERRIHERRVRSLTLEQPPLPDFSSFHFAFRGRSVEGRAETRDGDIRSAFFLSYEDANCEYIGMVEAGQAIAAGRELVSALFVIPYPPGFPILVPGQVISAEILQFMAALDVREIHGFRPELGFRIFSQAALDLAAQATAARAALALAGRAPSRRPATRPRRPNRRLPPRRPRRQEARLQEQEMSNKVTSISDLQLMFHRNERPIYFISATNFNLLGMDRWVNRFRYINYIDCFDGRHPNVFVPQESPHAEFESIEDINNYLLQHKDVIDMIERRGGKPVATFLMFDEKTEALAKELGMEVWFPPAALRTRCDNKMETVRIGNKAGVHSVPNALEKVDSYAHLMQIADRNGLGRDLVVQSAFGDSGHTTFFIASEDDFNKHKDEIVNDPEVKIMKRINCRGATLEPAQRSPARWSDRC